MISLIIKSYLTILISVALGALLLVTGGLFIIFRLFSNHKVTIKSVAPWQIKSSALTVVDSGQHELSAIAGDDLVATQLDLARAYIELNNQHAAATLLKMVCEQGSQSQQDEARGLLTKVADIQFIEHVRNKSRK